MDTAFRSDGLVQAGTVQDSGQLQSFSWTCAFQAQCPRVNWEMFSLFAQKGLVCSLGLFESREKARALRSISCMIFPSRRIWRCTHPIVLACEMQRVVYETLQLHLPCKRRGCLERVKGCAENNPTWRKAPHGMLYQKDALREARKVKGTRSLDKTNGRGSLNGRHVANPMWDAMSQKHKRRRKPHEVIGDRRK